MPLFCSRCGSRNESAGSCVACGAKIGHVSDGVDPSPSQDPISGDASSSAVVWMVTGIVCALYLVYPSMGVFELIPDMIPVIGSLDEAAATTGLLLSLTKLGWLNPFSR